MDPHKSIIWHTIENHFDQAYTDKVDTFHTSIERKAQDAEHRLEEKKDELRAQLEEDILSEEVIKKLSRKVKDVAVKDLEDVSLDTLIDERIGRKTMGWTGRDDIEDTLRAGLEVQTRFEYDAIILSIYLFGSLITETCILRTS